MKILLLLCILISFTSILSLQMSLLQGPIGFVGVGIMGKGMIKNLATKLPNPLIIWNRSSGPADEMAAQFPGKITTAPTAADVVKQCQVTFAMLSNEEASISVFDDEANGIIAGVSAGKVIVDCATLSPERLMDESRRVIAKGGVLLEAPVSGSKVPAETGTLVFLCGGPKEVYDGVYPALESMGKASFLFGPVGQGSKVKLIVNMMMGNIMTTLSEGITLSEALDLDSNELLKVLDLSAIAAPILQVKGKAILANKYDPNFPLKHAQKDMRLALELASNAGVSLPVSTVVNEQFKKGLATHGDDDFSAVHLTYKENK